MRPQPALRPTGSPDAETKRILTGTLIRAMKRAGMTANGAAVRRLLPLVVADRRLYDDAALCAWLMVQVPGGRKPKVARDHRLKLAPS